MTDQDAWEGGYTLEGYKKKFKEIYGFWDKNFIVWVVEFELIESLKAKHLGQ